MTSLRRFLSEENGTATIEFVLLVPLIMTIFFASFESSFYMIRKALLERSVDIIVRDIRLGNLDDLTHLQLKRLICQTSALVANVQTCVRSMSIWMQPIDTANFNMVAPPRYCVDRSAPFNPLVGPPPEEFRFGADNEIMLMRICLKEEPIFPTTIIGAGLVEGGENDGNYAIMTTTVFVNEPG